MQQLPGSVAIYVTRPAERPYSLVLLIGVPLAALSILGAFLIPDRGGDYRVFTDAAHAWWHGGSAYVVRFDTPNLAPPWLLPLFALIQPLGFTGWTLLGLLAIGLSARTIARLTPWTPAEISIGTLALTGSAIGLGTGQLTWLLLALVTAMWASERRGASIRAAVILGVLCACKPFFGVFLIDYVRRRCWRELSIALGPGALLAVVSVALVGPSELGLWLSHLREVAWQRHVFNGSVWGLADRWFTPHRPTQAATWTPLIVSPWLAGVTGWGLAVSVAVVAWRASRTDQIDHRYTVLGLAALLLSPLGWMHYLPAFVGPIAGVIDRRWWPVVLLAVVPYPLLTNQAYGVFGTVVVGLWAPSIVAGGLLLVARADRARASRSNP